MTYKRKQPKSICMKAFPEQFKKLRPENSAAGGIKARSQSKAIRDAVYNAINELYAAAHPYCDACWIIWPNEVSIRPHHFRDDTHHMRGKDGLLYFDVRYFKSVCRRAHSWIGAHPAEAVKLGLLSKEWNKLA